LQTSFDLDLDGSDQKAVGIDALGERTEAKVAHAVRCGSASRECRCRLRVKAYMAVSV
jgi:hypothetical protein